MESVRAFNLTHPEDGVDLVADGVTDNGPALQALVERTAERVKPEKRKLRPELTSAPVRRSKHAVKVRRGWQRDDETVLYGPPVWVSRTKRRPWDVVAERRAANRRARAARKANR